MNPEAKLRVYRDPERAMQVPGLHNDGPIRCGALVLDFGSDRDRTRRKTTKSKLAVLHLLIVLGKVLMLPLVPNTEISAPATGWPAASNEQDHQYSHRVKASRPATCNRQ